MCYKVSYIEHYKNDFLFGSIEIHQFSRTLSIIITKFYIVLTYQIDILIS